MAGVVSLRGEPITPPGEPDAAAIEVARDALERLQAGECNGVVVILSYSDGATGYRIGGSRVLDNRTLGALSRAMHYMNCELDKP